MRKRYGADYQVITVASVDAALGVLGELSDTGRQVSLVLADQWLSGSTGTELLGRVRQLHPGARRVLLITWGDEERLEPMLQATILGDIDAYVVKPGPSPDEHFHRFVTEQLDEWGRSNLPGLEVVRVVGEEWEARSHELRELLGRNGVPFGFYPAGSPAGQRLLGEASAGQNALPAVILFDGRILADPSNAEVGQAIGVHTTPRADRYDVTVIGAGPGGLAAAVYSASEGLATVILEPEAIGGQAGTSSLIRNYLGFPTGVSGGDLAVRAYTQAWNFGAEYVYGSSATGLRPDGSQLAVTLADGTEVHSRAVIVATGMAYRRLAIPELDALTGAGVFYGAAATEARAMKDREVFVVGGANSSGQAAVHLARYAAQVTVLVRGPSLANSMSEYLIREIESAPNIAVRYKVAVTGGAGRGRLETLTLTDLETSATETVAAAALFVLIGAEPRTQWLPSAVRRDQAGFVLTGNDLLEHGQPQADWPLERMPMFLESSLPGVFAVGDVRHGSVKRVASAVGEGSIAIRLVHDHLRAD
ncbi:MAG TPA: FAD-dependent oxidoreductase [Streptosporangiaceae bacterium]|nr:FAD-dependent oxidoreductase [Streptosporangiaceae bacterium]